MAIYTSYFANWRKFPEGAYTLGVTRHPPKGVDNWVFVSPSDELLRDYKAGRISEHIYSRRYMKELSYQNREGTIAFLRDLEHKYGNVVLCCYEKKGDFCHRQLLAEWLKPELEINEL